MSTNIKKNIVNLSKNEYNMSTMNEKYLVLRGKNKDIYFIQKRLSKEQASVIGKDFIKKSLETTDLQEAIIKRDKILAEINQIYKKNTKISNYDQEITSNKKENIYKSELIEENINKAGISSKDLERNTKKIDMNDNMLEISVPMSSNNVNSNYEYKNNKKYTIFTLKIPKFPEKDDLVIKIDKIIPIVIVIFTLFIAFIA